MKLKSKFLATVAAAALVVAVGTGSAAATDSLHVLTEEAESSSIQDRYTDAQILEVLFNGTGPVADENPLLLERLNFADEYEKADPELLAEVIDRYLTYHPTFDVDVLEPITSGNPELVEAGLATLTTTYLQMLQDEYGVEVSASAARADCGAGAWFCVVVYVAGFVNVAVYANAAVATLAVVALAVVPAAITYLMDEDSQDSVLVKDELVAALTLSLAE